MDRTAFFVVTICVILLYLTWPNHQSPSQERVGSTNSIDSPLIVNSTNNSFNSQTKSIVQEISGLLLNSFLFIIFTLQEELFLLNW